MAEMIIVPQGGVALYPPPSNGWPWLVVVLRGAKVESATPYDDERAARTALVEASLKFARDAAEKEQLQKKGDDNA
ncbi:hypothetical protein IVB40_34980 [Bradyrhizobium sp. 40]|uniref:hypothetical protein n=1 Tax=Bradyrhizobium sp. 40 TaxID=2782674 RepID=UPI0020002062|nr:hypothetical protein [Bradyrhizobium sp. 40]UPJ42407.1 hypothetical protein IVB40_34980 [Bradyrhizobium sp. 40]